jgi:hypothetical protein
MPSHVRIDGGYTIAAQPEPQYWSWNWFGDNPPPEGGNKGPVIFQEVRRIRNSEGIMPTGTFS